MTTPFEGFSRLAPGAPAEIGRYRLYARLGVGGMGQVFLSFLPGGRPVALKVVREEFAADPEFRRRFAQEARAAQQVNGIHIAQLLDADPTAPTPWLATAYIPGPSLLEAVRLHGPLPADSVRVLVAGIAQALEAIHAAGLIHRDLKPANVILAADGPRVIDFGIARAADATTASLTGKRIGSPQYMAPEQVRGLPATPALDVFALGALAFFAATGRPAFGEGEDLAVIFRVVQEQPDLTGCPPELLDLVTRCLAKDPAERPDTRAVFEACRGQGGPDAPGGQGGHGGQGGQGGEVGQGGQAGGTAAQAAAAGAANPQVAAGAGMGLDGAGAAGGAANPLVTGGAGGWLPPEIARSIQARTDAIAAIGAQPPPPSQPSYPPGSQAPHSPGSQSPYAPGSQPPYSPAPQAPPVTQRPQYPQAPTTLPQTGPQTLPQTGPTRPGTLTGVSQASQASKSGLAARLRVGAITLAFGVLIGAVLVLTVFRPTTSGSASATGGTHSPSASAATATAPANGTASADASPAATGSREVGQGGPLGASTASPFADTSTDTVQWQGAITFGKDGIGLDSVPPGGNEINADIAYAGSSNSASGYNLAASWGMALWTGTGAPSRSQCAALISGASSTGVVVAQGGLVCVKTLYDRMALIQVQSVDTTDNIVSAYVRVWAQPVGGN